MLKLLFTVFFSEAEAASEASVIDSMVGLLSEAQRIENMNY